MHFLHHLAIQSTTMGPAKTRHLCREDIEGPHAIKLHWNSLQFAITNLMGRQICCQLPLCSDTFLRNSSSLLTCRNESLISGCSLCYIQCDRMLLVCQLSIEVRMLIANYAALLCCQWMSGRFRRGNFTSSPSLIAPSAIIRALSFLPAVDLSIGPL